MRSHKALLAFLIVALLGCSGEESAIQAQALLRTDGERAMEFLRRQTAFGPRVPGSQAHLATRDFLVAELEKTADTVQLQPFVHADIEMFNIVATFGRGEKPVLLCAHWDTRPFADRDPDPANRDTPIDGANDGASGVAVLLEIARRMSDAPPPVPVVIALFDGEDWGRSTDEMFLGSRRYAENPLPSTPRFGVLLDMVGDADLSIPIEPISYRAAPTLIRAIWESASELGETAFVSRTGPTIQDDHVSLIEAGIPAVDLIDFSYPYWHTLEDTPDKCSAESLRIVGDVLLRFLYTRVDP